MGRTHCTVSPGNGSSHVGWRKLGLREFQEPEKVQGGPDLEPMPGALIQKVLSQCDFNALKSGVGVGETSWAMKDPLFSLG